MKFNKPKFWSTNRSILSFLLMPFTLVVMLVTFLRRSVTNSIKFKIPIICIGNLYIGGTGKTPASIFVAQALLKIGKNPAIIRKFYKSHKDEHNLITSNFKNLILNKNRVLGIREAEMRNHDIAILDDGFQDHKIKKNLNIICFNSKQLVGNGLVLPAGPLRESLNSLKHVDIILINGPKNYEFEQKVLKLNKNLKIFYSYYRPLNLESFRSKKLLAVAGIGNPENFFELLEKSNLEISKKLIFPDHYEFTRDEVQKIEDYAENKDLHIIMTEKDYYKINNFKISNISFLKVSLEIENENAFMKKIKEFYA